MQLRKTRVYFGYANVMPLGSVTSQDILDLEKVLRDHFEIVGKNIPREQHYELRCQSGQNIFTLKIQLVGQVQTALPEPIHAVTIIIGDNGLHDEMPVIYNHCLESISKILEIPRFVATKEATLRFLYGKIDEGISFRYLWETILGQSGERLRSFGKIAGGGLRFLIAAKPLKQDSSEVAQADIKVESSLKDPRYIFVEAKYNWVMPTQYDSLDQFKEANNLNCNYVIETTEKSVNEFLGEQII